MNWNSFYSNRWFTIIIICGHAIIGYFSADIEKCPFLAAGWGHFFSVEESRYNRFYRIFSFVRVPPLYRSDLNLLSHLTAVENIELSMKASGKKIPNKRQLALEFTGKSETGWNTCQMPHIKAFRWWAAKGRYCQSAFLRSQYYFGGRACRESGFDHAAGNHGYIW